MAKFLFRLVLNTKTRMRPIFSIRYETSLVNKEFIIWLKRNLFPLLKANISKFQFDQESGRRRTSYWMCYRKIFIYLFIYILFAVDSLVKLFYRSSITCVTLPHSSFRNVPAGTELTWDYAYEVDSVKGKVLHCYCGSAECRGRLL